MNIKLPQRSLKFLRWFCREDYLDEIEGDLLEIYKKEFESSPRKAKWKFTWSVFKYFRPEFIKSFNSHQSNAYGMYKSYFKIGWRNLLKEKGYSFINMIGLSVGMTACLLITMYVRFENSYDTFHEHSTNLYRVSMDRYVNGNFKFKSAKTYPAISPRLKEDFPEIADYARVMPDHGIVSQEDSDQRHYENHILLADASFFNLFSFNVIQGNPNDALSAPYTMALSASAATKYFADKDPIGETLHFYKDDGTQEVYKITALFEDVPKNSHLQFDILFSYTSLQQRYRNRDPDWRPSEDSWEVDNYYSYVLLNENVNPFILEEKFPDFFNQYKGELFKARNVREELHLQPIESIHLHSELQSEIGVTGNYRFVYFMILIACFIILIAWINYINITTAKLAERVKEVGIRKTLGSRRSQLISQFLFESILVNGFSFILSAFMFWICQPLFQVILGFEFKNDFSQLLFALGLLFGLSLTGVILVSLYPALMLSGFKPVQALKGKVATDFRGMHLRKALITVQFVASIFIITGLLTIRQQISFMKNKDLGFDADKLMVVKAASFLKDGAEQLYEKRSVSFKDRLKQHRQIVNVTESGFVPGQEIVWRQGMVRKVSSDPATKDTYSVFAVDENFFETYNIETVAGKVFSEEFIPMATVVINEAAAQRLGFLKSQDALGEEIYVDIDYADKAQIVGIIKNYHHLSLKNDIQPQVFFYRAATWSYFTIKLSGNNLQYEMEIVKGEFSTAFPDNPFEYFFLDQFFNSQYQADQKFEKIFALFSTLAILISCTGLFGLMSYTIVQRTKEIGIHKVLGASIGNLAVLLSKDLVKLVLLASVLILPVTYFATNKWLNNYAYHINVTSWLLIAPVLIVLMLATITISYQSFKAALTNPVKSLRSE
jgi:putative ABC transport system permease protein